MVGVLLELLGKDQQAVQRCAQLVRHVGDELGLVPRGHRELPRLLHHQALRLLDLDVLALRLDVLLGEQLGLPAEILVRLAQLLLLGLRLLQEVLGEGVGFDGVQDQADALRKLIEEGLVGRAEGGERGELDHGAHRSFEQHGQHDDVERRRRAEPRADPHVVTRHLAEQDPLLLLGALAHQALSEPEGGRQLAPLLVAVRGLELEHRLTTRGLSLIHI